MQNLLLLLARYGNFMLFIILEVLCFYLIINYNQSQKEIFLNSSNLFSGYVLDKKENVRSYVGLKTVNEDLHQENARLLQKSFIARPAITDTSFVQDTTVKFRVIPATIINNSVRQRNNSITLDKGSNHGLQKGMGVISSDGIVGIIRNVSPKYAQVLSVLNSQSRISAKIQGRNYHGNLVWKGWRPTELTLEAVPKHAEVANGDTIITSGYSSVFPPNIMIGTVKEFSVPQGNSNYVIDVSLSNDISKITYVYIIENMDKEEIKRLENDIDE